MPARKSTLVLESIDRRNFAIFQNRRKAKKDQAPMGTGCSACTKFTRDEDHWERVDGSIFILSALSKVFTGNKEIVKLLGK